MDQEWRVRSKLFGREKPENAVRSDPHVLKDGERSNREFQGHSAVPRAFFFPPPLDWLFSEELLGEGPERHTTCGFRVCRHSLTAKTLISTNAHTHT